MFNHRRLVLGRKRRKMTARALAAAIGVTPITVSRWENGNNEPEDTTIDAIAKELRFPRGFFYAGDFDDLPEKAASFRSMSAMTARERDAALAAGSIAYLFNDWISERFNLPAADVPNFGAESSPGSAAQAVREYWGLGQKPIPNMIKLLEAKGVRVFSLCEDTRNVDAFSCWRNNQPFIFLNTYKSTERSRFDAAHELGHLVLHRHGPAQDSRQAEAEANEFASNFLMPFDDLVGRIHFITSVKELVQAKKRWGVSVAALAYRLNKLDIVSEWQHRSLQIEINRQNYRTKEPDSLPAEESIIWPQVLSALWSERITREHIAAELLIPLQELEGILFKLIGRNLPPAKTGKSQLRLVS
ncbi:helix-turn-helix domain-containing protein [Methylobacterium sp. NFXW15]|jgi:Zn-dependent peptidase ImmA (M78 family)/DNA-binding XRE family transcriptional regulator|uniref:helix-turn-helix domain-containing protein n=1 Tax=Methylobacterium sp. NFXW15 TaxID=2819512 RepID=UPI003CEA023C